MVDVYSIEKLLKYNFIIKGEYQIDPATGVVDVQGSVTMLRSLKQLPLQFGHVTGDFTCVHSALISLQGSPAQVGGYFMVYANNLTSLTGAPNRVGGTFDCSNNKLISLEGAPNYVGYNFTCYANPLISLEGAPEYVGGNFLTIYAQNLPLLRTLVAQEINFAPPYPAIVRTILDKYTRHGKAGALLAAAELIRAGYRENAKW